MAFDLTPGSTTAIGSLPHKEEATAIDFVLGSGIDVPFWPQLPKKDFREWMIPQYGADLPGFQLDEDKKRFQITKGDDFVDVLTAFYERVLDPDAEFPLAPDHATGYYAFVDRLGRDATKNAIVKGHVTGPLTFTLGLNQEDGRPVYADEEMRQASIQLLARNAGWQAKQLSRLATAGVIVFIDEPIYSALGTAAYLAVKADDVRSTLGEVSAAVRAEGGLSGVHCCGNADWETVLSSDIDVLNFDAWGFASTLAVYSKAIAEFLERGGTLAWGIVPTNEEITGATEQLVATRLDAAVEEFVSRGVDRTRLINQSIITPSCGCGSLSVELTQKVFALLAAAGAHWKAKT